MTALVVIEVPAGPHLYDAFDAYLHHRRRYASHDVAQMVRTSGLEVVHQSHLGCFAYPAFWLVKRRNKRRLPPGASGEDVHRVMVEDLKRTLARP